jgi:thioredoxin reductase (NADPH)
MKNFDVAIIGGGPAGIFSAFACGMQRLSCIIFDNLPQLGGQCTALYPNKNIYDIPGFKKITSSDLIENLKEQAFSFNPEIRLNHFVKNIYEHENIFKRETAQGNIFKIETAQGDYFANSVVIALGNGIFGPVKPILKDLDKFEGSHLFYDVDDFKKFENETVVIAGGGDSALDWAIELSEVAKKIYLVHRREHVSAHPASWQKVLELAKLGKIELKIPYVVCEIMHDNFQMYGLNLENFVNKEKIFIEAKYFLPCFGIRSDVGFLKNWDLKLENNRIAVDFFTMRTSRKGIYAVGDCAHYLHKRNLILTGFAEAMQCSVDIFKYLHPYSAPDWVHSTDSDLFK